MSDERALRLNISLPPRVERMADVRADATGETRSGYIARLIREDWKRSGGRTDDERLRPRDPHND